MERMERLKEFLQANPGDSFVAHALALEYVKTGDEAAARTLFESLLAKDPGYVGSYYHLAKLLERSGDTGGALAIYEKGMQQAKAAGDNHAFSELRSAFEELSF